MKIAILLSGLPRRQMHNMKHFRKFIKSEHEIQIFSHCWVDPYSRNLNSPNISRKKEKSSILVRILNRFGYRVKNARYDLPESWDLGDDLEINNQSVLDFFPWHDQKSKDMNNFRMHLLSNNISMWKSIKIVFEIFNEQSALNTEQFDYIVRMRFDVIPQINIDEIVKLATENKILVPFTSHPPFMINDWFAIGTPELMEIYCCLWDDFREIFMDTQNVRGVWCNELGLFQLLKMKGIDFEERDLSMRFG